MASAKLVVLYPSPRDVKEFERAYTQDAHAKAGHASGHRYCLRIAVQ